MIVFIAKVAYLEGLALHKLFGRLVEKGFKLSGEDTPVNTNAFKMTIRLFGRCVFFPLL